MDSLWALTPRLVGFSLYRLFDFPKLKPANITVSVTNRCNSRCLTCNIWKYYSERSAQPEQELTIEEYEKIFASLGKSPFWVTLSGGEPFLRDDLPAICKDIVEKCNPRIINIPSNGLLKDTIRKMTREILEIASPSSLIINLSIDGLWDRHDQIRGVPGNFDGLLETYRNLTLLKQTYPELHVGIHSVVSRYSIDNLLEVYEYVKTMEPDSYITEVAEERSELFNIGERITPDPTTYSNFVDETTMFRAGVSGEDGFLGMWFNYVSQIPQTRDYHSAAVLQPDWHAWLMHGVWKEQDNYPETYFLLDWWSVKWLLVNSYEHNPAKFLSKPEHYKPVTNATLLSGAVTFYEFLCENVTPIASAGNQPTLLVIGKGQYRSALNILAYSDYNSERLIPVHGHDFVDDYSLDELQKFDAILLIGQQYHNRDRSWDLLRRYVEAGGGLIVETGIQFLTDDWNASSFPDAFPVGQTVWGNFGKKWKFSYTPSEISDGIRFNSFSPAISGEDPWSYSRSSNESVRSWAKAILLNNGYPVVVAGQLGKGRIVWSGMNLYFHIGVYKNDEEIKFAVRMIDWATRAQEYKTDNALYRAERVNPERVEVQLDGSSKGVLYKEFYFGNWRAFLTEINGRTYEVAIYKAGPDFMYAFVPRNASYPVKAVFEYHRELQYGSLIVSVGAFLLIVGYAIGEDRFTRMLAPALRFRSRSKSWETRSVRTGNSATSKKRS
jgi:hypothetical protein